jgi:hypothetical protein
VFSVEAYNVGIWLDRDSSDYLFDRLARTQSGVKRHRIPKSNTSTTRHLLRPSVESVYCPLSRGKVRKMTVETKQQYRGVLCLHCHQPIPLSSFAASNECGFKQQKASASDESTVRSFTVSSFTLCCRVCEGEGLYTALNVIDCSGTPRMRSSKVRKLLPIYPI